MFWAQFERLCTKAGMSPNAVAKELRIPSGSITAWKNGTEPRASTAKKIAERFGVTTEYLMFGSDGPEPPAPAKKEPPAETGEQFSPLDSRWFSLTEEEKLQAWEFIVQLRAKKQGGDGE